MRENLIKSYNAFAQRRESESIEDWKLQARHNFHSWLKKENKHTLLEIGPGPGKDARFFLDQGFDVTCIDLSPEMVKLCQQKGLKAFVMDMANLKFPDNSFDAVYALNSLLHIPKVEMPAVLKTISRVLNPDGLFFLGVRGGFDFEGVHEKDDYIPKRFFSFYTDEDLRKAVSNVFEIAYFKNIDVADNKNSHFQSLILRKRA